MLAALASSPATKALDPDPFPRHSLRHPVYAALLHFGFETADRKIVRGKLLAVSPPVGSRVGPKSSWTDLELLRNEFGKEKRFIPVRHLMTRAGRAIRALKPCFMMSPLSLAKFLPVGDISFDLVVIDEASQMKPEEAIGSILRTKQVVVVGDPKQLPPTDFFQRSEAASEDDDFVDVDDKSILAACQQMFRKTRLLRWHYRSRCESLIAFSNKEFYRGGLITFPTARPSAFSIELVPVGGNYQARRNVIEAQRVAEETIQFMRHHAEMDQDHVPSLGIVAINSPQRELIFEELRRLEAGDALVEAYLEKVARKHEPLFVKNLENVQGDERDFIFISLTYGPQAGQKHVLQRFGPISGKQGHRRLNVLFTRARERIVLFTSMTSADVKPSENAAEGPYILKRYLEYAETRGKAAVTSIGGTPDSYFETEVAERLRARGYNVEMQVGVSGFRIDLGIRHPDDPDRFLIGIECDGARYHSSKSARDRDRLREEVLQRLGWELLRIWSTDWFDDPNHQTERLVKEIESQRTKTKTLHSHYSLTPSYPAAAPLPQATPELMSEIDLVQEAEGPILNGHEVVERETPRVFIDDSPLTPAEVADALREFRNTVIAKNVENWQPHRSILREAMIETLIAQRITDPDDWFDRIPQFQRTATDPVEKKRYFERICDMSLEWRLTETGRREWRPISGSRIDPPAK